MQSNDPSGTEESTEPGTGSPEDGKARNAAERFAEKLPPRYGKAETERALGRGGIGEVVVAREIRLMREVALKRLRSDRASTNAEIRLAREARVTGLLEHPGIIPVHDIDRDEQGRLFYTMKQVGGRTLRELIEKLKAAEPGMTPEERAQRAEIEKSFGSVAARLEVFLKVCDALAFAHAHPLRVIHRDLKPENIMVGDFGEVMVMDWGLAKVLGEGEAAESLRSSLVEEEEVDPVSDPTSTLVGQFLGTPAYAPPEQLDGRVEEIDERSDVYALGGILYHLLSLEAPLTGDEPDPSSEFVQTGDPDSCGELPGSIPDRTETASVGSEHSTPHSAELVRQWCLRQIEHDATIRRLRGRAEESRRAGIPDPLAVVIRKAMEPDPGNRMASVADLAKQVRLHVQGFAGDYEQAGAWRHFSYFVRRHKTASLTAAAALAILAIVSTGFTLRIRDQLDETKRQLERSQLEEGRAWLERAKLAGEGEKNSLKALMFAGRAVGFHGFGRLTEESPDYENRYPGLLGTPMFDPDNNAARGVEEESLRRYVDGLPWVGLPVWSSPVLAHHRAPIKSVAFSPDGKRIASGSDDLTVKLWDAVSGKEIIALVGHVAAVNSLAFSPDGRRIVSGSDDYTLKLWDAVSGKEVATLEGHVGEVKSIAFSPDGRLLASGSSDNTVKLWDAVSGKEVATLEGHVGEVKSVAFSPDGRLLASGSSDNTVKLWDTDTRKELETFGKVSNDPLAGVKCVAFNPDGSRIASGYAGVVTLFDTATGTALATLKGSSFGTRSVTFSPDGRLIASCYSGFRGIDSASGASELTVKLWDAVSANELATFEAHLDSVNCVVFSPDSSRIVSGSDDYTLKLWDLASGKELAKSGGHSNAVTGLAFDPDGSRIASGSWDNTVKIWDAATGEAQISLAGHLDAVTSVAFRPDGSQIASGSWDNTVKLWDAVTGKELATLEGHSKVFASVVTTVAFSPDGSQIVAGSQDGGVKLWDTLSRKEIAGFEGHPKAVNSVAFSPDGSRIASGSEDETVILWDVRTGKELTKSAGHSEPVTSLAFSPDGSRIVYGAENGRIYLWDTATGEELLTLEGHSDKVTSVAFSPDGRRIASGASDKTLKLWDAANGRELARIEGHFDRVAGVAFSPDGSRIASCSWDKTVKLWEVSAGNEIATLAGHRSPIREIALSADGSKVASGSDDSNVKIWDATTGKEVATLDDHAYGVTGVAISPDGSQIASGSGDGLIKLWDGYIGKERSAWGADEGTLYSLAASPDGSRIAAGFMHAVKLWDVKSGKELGSLEGDSGIATSLVFSPNSSMLATIHWGGNVKLWDMNSRRVLPPLRGNPGSVAGVAFSPDGRQLSSVSDKGTVMLWDTKTGNAIAAPPKFPFAADGSVLSSDGLLRARVDGNRIVLTSNSNTLDLTAYERAGYFSLDGREVIWNINDSLLSGRSFSAIHQRRDPLAELANPDLAPARRLSLRIQLAAKGGAWRTFPVLWKGAGQTNLDRDPELRQVFSRNLAIAVRTLALKDSPEFPNELWSLLPEMLESESFSDPALSVSLAQAVQLLMQAEPITDGDMIAQLSNALLESAPRAWVDAVAASIQENRKSRNTAMSSQCRPFIEGALERYPSADLLRTNIGLLEAEDPSVSHLEDRLLKSAEATAEDFISAAYSAHYRGDSNRSKQLLSEAEDRFSDRRTKIHFAAGWIHLDLNEPEAAKNAFLAVRTALNSDDKPSDFLLIGLSLSQWLSGTREEAIASYCALIESGRTQENPLDWADSKTVSDSQWHEGAKNSLDEVRKATLDKHPELKANPKSR